jgi:PleD family two-component response regulator
MRNLSLAARGQKRRGGHRPPTKTGRVRVKAACEPVLVVDDDVECLEAMAETLEQNGYAVERALDARQAWAVCAERSLVAAVLDLWPETIHLRSGGWTSPAPS